MFYNAAGMNDFKDLAVFVSGRQGRTYPILRRLPRNITTEGVMAARLKDHEDDQWSQSVPSEGLVKLMKAIENPKKPTEALKRLMRDDKK